MRRKVTTGFSLSNRSNSSTLVYPTCHFSPPVCLSNSLRSSCGVVVKEFTRNARFFVTPLPPLALPSECCCCCCCCSKRAATTNFPTSRIVVNEILPFPSPSNTARLRCTSNVPQTSFSGGCALRYNDRSASAYGPVTMYVYSRWLLQSLLLPVLIDVDVDVEVDVISLNSARTRNLR